MREWRKEKLRIMAENHENKRFGGRKPKGVLSNFQAVEIFRGVCFPKGLTGYVAHQGHPIYDNHSHGVQWVDSK